MAKKICRWCGKEYEFMKTPSRDPHKYCSKRCETAAKNEESQHSSYSRGSGGSSGGGSKKWMWIVLIIILVVSYCSKKNDGKEEKVKTENAIETNE